MSIKVVYLEKCHGWESRSEIGWDAPILYRSAVYYCSLLHVTSILVSAIVAVLAVMHVVAVLDVLAVVVYTAFDDPPS